MKRIRSYDLVRVICCCLIVYYHMTVQLAVDGICDHATMAPLHSNSNMHIATMAVAVFFMLSGASLGVTTRERFSLKTYYKKRLVRLLVPFYLATFVCMAFILAAGVHIPNFDPAGTPKWRIIFTLLGLDSWLTMHQVQTFALVGEWFLGALLILSVLFPLFRLLIRKYPRGFLLVATVIYGSVLVLYGMGRFDFVVIHFNLLLKGYEFILGIYLGMYREKISTRWCALTIPVCLIFFFCPVAVPVSEGLKITLLGLCFFLSFSCLEGWLGKRKLRAVDVLSGCSYELFLCHHMIIHLVCMVLEPRLSGAALLVVMFAGELVGMAVTTTVLKLISDRVTGLLLEKR